MVQKVQQRQAPPPFGVTQALTVLVIMIVTVIASALLFSWKVYLPLAPYVAPPAINYLIAGLWVAELIVYTLICKESAEDSWAVVGGGVALGLVTRLTTGLFIFIFTRSMVAPEHGLLAMAVNHVLALIGAYAAFQMAYMPLLDAKFRFAPPPKKSKGPSSNQFHFNQNKPTGARQPVTIRRQVVNTGMPSQELIPPADFNMGMPPKDVHGTINIPREVIVKCIPEADIYLQPKMPVRIRTAFFVAQLYRASAWLTWEQVMSPDPMHSAHAAAQPLPGEELKGRWVRIPPRHYVLQIPREHYDRSTTQSQPLPPWARLPEVPQEQDFEMMSRTSAPGSNFVR